VKGRKTLLYLIPWVVLGLWSGCRIPGCLVPPCVVSDTLVEVNDASIPTVPDQEIPGCFNVSIVRTFGNDAERDMIRMAEELPSTAGPTWVSTTKTTGLTDANGNPVLSIADAVTAEALTYFAKHMLSLQTSTDPEIIQIYLYYSARLVDAPIGPLPVSVAKSTSHRPIVRLDLQYSEEHRQDGYHGSSTWREVEFDQTGAVIEIRGDGEAIAYGP
jgi:hypothetical protein